MFKLAAGLIAQPPEDHSNCCKIGLFGRDYKWLSNGAIRNQNNPYPVFHLRAHAGEGILDAMMPSSSTGQNLTGQNA